MDARTDTQESPDDRTRAHYASLLAPIYRWMLGDFDAALSRSRAELAELGVGAPKGPARALDLGSGPGLQSIPLADLGYDVTAVDGSDKLLSELLQARPNVRAVRADLAAPSEFIQGFYDVIVCMGDTLTHLSAKDDVRALLAAAGAALVPGGRLVLTFRDYGGPPRRSIERFILVRGDADRVLTCCLDYDAERVRVTDVLHERTANGWSVRASEYPKLRLSRTFVEAELAERGLSVERSESRSGRIAIVSRRRAWSGAQREVPREDPESPGAGSSDSLSKGER